MRILRLLGIPLISLVVAGGAAGLLVSSGDELSIPETFARELSTGTELEMFLKLDGVAGDSADQKHRGEISVDSYAWSIKRAPGEARASMPAFTVTMPASRALPKLLPVTAGGVKVSRAVLSVRTKGAGQDFLRWVLTDASIAALSTVGNTAGDGVSAKIDIAFGKIEVEYQPSDGSSLLKSGWDQRTGKSVSY